MKNNRICIGTIMMCTECTTVPHFTMEDCSGITCFGHIEHKEEIYKENAVLLKTKNGLYIDMEELALIDIPYLYFENKKSVYYWEPYMFSSSYGSYKNQLFVDSDSIRPYAASDKSESVSLMKLRKDVRNRK